MEIFQKKKQSLFTFFEKAFEDSTDNFDQKGDMKKFLEFTFESMKSIVDLTSKLTQAVSRDKIMFEVLQDTKVDVNTMFKAK